jgi:Sodium/hydrogen exchanger family
LAPKQRFKDHLNIALGQQQQVAQRSRTAISSSTTSKTKKNGPKSTERKRDDPLRGFRTGKSAPTADVPFDINGPPVYLPPGETIKKIKRRDAGVSDEFLVRQGPDPPAQQHTVKKAETVTAPLHAVDSLQCGESVKNFVVNATDGKDECDGLIKAFDKSCNNDAEDEEITPLGNGSRRLKRTKLSEKLGLASYGRRWRTLVYRSSRDFGWLMSFMPWYWLERVPVDRAIVNAWHDASYVTNNNLEGSCLRDERIMMHQASRALARRKLDESLNQTNDSKLTEPVTTLKLPTSHKMSEKSGNDALLLQQGEKVIKQANETIAAANEEAAKSKKSIAETSAAIMEVLSDPSSVAARTCCISILNVYQDLCSNDEQEQVSDSKLFFFVLVMALCGMVKSLIRYFKIVWLPEPGGCIIVGVLSGYALEYFPHHSISFDGNWFLRILVPPIVFEAALSIDKRSFNRHLVPIIIYAVIGTLVATVLTAEIVHNGTHLFSSFCTPIPYVEALTFGALISSIDPIAVLSVLNNMGMNDTDTIYVLIFGESLLNDGVAIVLFHTLVHFLDENLVIDDDAITAAVIHFFVVAFGFVIDCLLMLSHHGSLLFCPLPQFSSGWRRFRDAGHGLLLDLLRLSNVFGGSANVLLLGTLALLHLRRHWLVRHCSVCCCGIRHGSPHPWPKATQSDSG